MVKKISTAKLRATVAAVLDDVSRNGTVYLAHRYGEELAVIVSADEHRRMADAAAIIDALRSQLASAELKAEAYELDARVAQDAASAHERRAKTAEARVDELAEEVTNLRDDFGMSAPSGRRRRRTQ